MSQFDNLITAQMFLGSFGLLYYMFMSDLVYTSVQQLHDWWITGVCSWDHGPFNVKFLNCVIMLICVSPYGFCVFSDLLFRWSLNTSEHLSHCFSSPCCNWLVSYKLRRILVYELHNNVRACHLSKTFVLRGSRDNDAYTHYCVGDDGHKTHRPWN